MSNVKAIDPQLDPPPPSMVWTKCPKCDWYSYLPCTALQCGGSIAVCDHCDCVFRITVTTRQIEEQLLNYVNAYRRAREHDEETDAEAD